MGVSMEALIGAGVKTATQTVKLPASLRSARGVVLFANVTANPAGGETLTLHFDLVDPVSGATLSTGNLPIAAANGLYVLVVHPDVPPGGSNPKFLQAPVPQGAQARVVHSGGGNWNYTLTAVPIT